MNAIYGLCRKNWNSLVLKVYSFLLKTFQTNLSYCWMSVLVSGLRIEESFLLLVSMLQTCCLVKIK